MSSGMPILVLCSSTRSLQSTGKWVLRDGLDTHTTDGHSDLETELDKRVDSVKICYISECVLNPNRQLWICFQLFISSYFASIASHLAPVHYVSFHLSVLHWNERHQL